MLAILGASGKIGGATLDALLSRNLVPPSEIVALTSSKPEDPKWQSLSSTGVNIRHASFDDPSSFQAALQGVDKLFLVSSPRIWLDYDPVVPAPPGHGREKDHFVVLEAAIKAGVKHVYYTSLAFANPSLSNVMTAHERTEARLRELESEGKMGVTFLREGLYNESWPLYLGYFDPKGDRRDEIVLADEGGGKLSWTAIRDLGIANAMILADEVGKWSGKCVYLSRREGARSMADIASLVGEAVGRRIEVKSVSKEEHVEHYVKERGMDDRAVRWWVDTYPAIKGGECKIDDSTFDELMEKAGAKPISVEQTVREMLSGQ